MGKLKGLWLLTAALMAALSFANTGDTVTRTYFVVGGTLELKPSVDSSDPINHILWKLGDNLVAEWIESASLLDYYDTFKNRTHLDMNTGRLRIRNMAEADQGVYTLGINGKLQAVSYETTLIVKLPQPEVLISPLRCTDTSDHCNVSCAANTDKAGPVSYSWRFGAEEWKELTLKETIGPDTHGHAKDITCRIKNPVSEETSEPVDNPLFKPSTIHHTGWAVPLVIIMLLLGGGGLAAAWKFKIGPFKEGQQQTAEQSPSEPSEDLPLNDKSADAKEA